MENNVDMETAQLAYAEAKEELLGKVGLFALCMGIFIAFFRIVFGYESFFQLMECSFTFTLIMYLPFKICYKMTGSILSALIGGFVLVIIVGLVLGDSSTLLALILLGGLALDFGISISKLLKIKKLLTSDSQ